MKDAREKFFIGVSFGFNASACLVSSERGLLAAISQERLNGVKNTKEIPISAILECCRINRVHCVERIAYAHYQVLTMDEILRYASKKYLRFAMLCKTPDEFFVNELERNGISVMCKDLYRVEHHTAHAMSSYGFYEIPDEEHYTITSDGFGDGYSGKISRVCTYRIPSDCVGSGSYKILMETLSQVDIVDSIALVYQFTTGALGFKEHQHEGKITGLAAFGMAIYFDDYNKMFSHDSDFANGNGLRFKFEDCEILSEEDLKMAKTSTIKDFEKFLMMKKKVYSMVNGLVANGAKREDIACSVQMWAETKTIDWIMGVFNDKNIIDGLHRNSVSKCFLSGGLFANVRINQKLEELGIFKNVAVCPSMGDEGTCIGSAIYMMMKSGEYRDNKSERGSAASKVFCGNSIRNHDAKNVSNILLSMGWTVEDESSDVAPANPDVIVSSFCNDDELTDEIVDALARKKIVCLVRGRMEFGPRALCHRSILYDCTDKETNDWLNKQLGRTEFMPFAPVCLEEDAATLFKLNGTNPENFCKLNETAKFMTMTFDCKPEFIARYPAAAHIDGTARPQFVSKEESFTHKLLTKYKKKTGLSVLINTSFNLHNNPIISSTNVAIESWLTSNTDVLVLENTVVKRCKK